MSKVVIIGGGIIGQFSAYYLNKSGHQVTIVDDNPKMTPASYGNCGLITPSHIEPLNSWRMIFRGLKSLGKKDAPLSIKPQFDKDFISWLLLFALKANKKHRHFASAYRHQLLQLSWSLYEQFSESFSDIEFRKEGFLMNCHTNSGLKEIEHEVKTVSYFKLPARMLSQEEVMGMEPTLKSSLGGALFECDGWLNPTSLMELLKRLNKLAGIATIDAEANLSTSNGQLVSEFPADYYVIAAGAQSAILAKELGISLNMIPGKGYNLTASSIIPKIPKRPIYLAEKKVVLTPWKNRFRIGSTMEFAGFDLSHNEARLSALKNAVSEAIDVDFEQFEYEEWTGWRPMTYNDLPIIQKSNTYSNLILATGHGMLGLTLAPATGYLVDCLVNGKPHNLHTNLRS